MKTIRALLGLDKKKTKTQSYEYGNPMNSSQPNQAPTKDLFIDDSHPNEQRVLKKFNSELISDYLNQDYHQIGIQEGFSMHSNEAAESRKQLIKSNFRNLLNQIIDKNREDILKLSNSLIEVSELSKELKEKLENKITFLKSEIDDLDLQKQLSAENEGLVMSAIHNYHQGFLSGLRSYFEMEKIINKNY